MANFLLTLLLNAFTDGAPEPSRVPDEPARG
jgi:hypothetical protein